MTDAIGIGFFQMDNLVRNRIPFCLFTIDVEFDALYKGQELEHIKRYEHCLNHASSTEVHHILETKKYRKIDPVLVVCQNGIQSRDLANQLGVLGYLNCYFVEGGFDQLRQSSREADRI